MTNQTDSDLREALEKLSVETKKLEEVASLPLPDVSEFIDTSLQDTDGIPDNTSMWALNMPHFLGDKDVNDIRSLKPDPFCDDTDADRASLYWYVKSKRSLSPNCELVEDPVFNSMVDRVVFGFSLHSKIRQRRNAAEVEELAEKMFRVIEATKTLEKRRFLKKVNDAAIVIQRLFLGRKTQNAKKSRLLDAVASKFTRIKKTTTKTKGTSNEQLTDQNTTEQDYLRTTKRKGDTLHEGSPHPEIFIDTNTNERSEWFVNGLLRKVNRANKNPSLFCASFEIITRDEAMPCSCLNVRLAYTPLLEELEKLGRVYTETNAPMTLMTLVDKISKQQNNEPLTPLSFGKSVSSISIAISDDLVKRMGGFETMMQSSMALLHYFSSSKPMDRQQHSIRIRQRVQDFLQNMKRSDCQIAATYLGVLLDKIGAKRNSTGRAMVDDFVKSHSNNSFLSGPFLNVSKTAFLKWLSSSKPKLDAGDMDALLSELSSCDDNVMDKDRNFLISMSKFLELCYPKLSTNQSSIELQREIGIFLSGEFGSKALDWIVTACREADVAKSGLVSWKGFLVVSLKKPSVVHNIIV